MKKTLLVLVGLAFAAWVGTSLAESLADVDLDQLRVGFRRVRSSALILALALVVADYALLSSYDYLGYRLSGTAPLQARQIMGSAFVCYAFTLNLGALVGGLGLRYRLYTRWKITRRRIFRIILFSISANWSGYCLLLAALLLSRPTGLQRALPVPPWGLVALGGLALLVVVAYLVACGRGSTLTWKGRKLPFPGLPVAALQLGMSLVQWNLVASILFVFLRELDVPMTYPEVLMGLLLAGVAGVLTHVPAGMGVLEVVFLRLGPAGHTAPILVALLCYRAAYYLLPLAVAVPTYLGLEYRLKPSGGARILPRRIFSRR